jgi:hypothetical protein
MIDRTSAIRFIAWVLCASTPSLAFAAAPASDEYIGALADVPVIFGEPSPPSRLGVAQDLHYARYTVRDIAAWCSTHVPESGPAIRAAEKTWGRQHAALMTRAIEVIRKDSYEGAEADLDRQAQAINEWGRKRLAAQPRSEQARWCTRDAPLRIASERFRFHDDAEAKTLLSTPAKMPVDGDVGTKPISEPEAPRGHTGVISKVSRRNIVLDESLHIGFVGDESVLRKLEELKPGDRVLALFGTAPRPDGPGRINKLLSIRLCADQDAECDAVHAQEEAEDQARSKESADFIAEHERCIAAMRQTLEKDPRHVSAHEPDIHRPEVTARLNALTGDRKACAQQVRRAHVAAVDEACELHHCGDRIGGGCAHIAGYSLNSHLIEVAVEKCSR